MGRRQNFGTHEPDRARDLSICRKRILEQKEQVMLELALLY